MMNNNSFDLIEDVFTLVPAQVLCEFLGIPVEKARWMDDLGKIIQVADPNNIDGITKAWDELFGYVEDLVEGRALYNETGLVAHWQNKMKLSDHANMTNALLKGTLMGVVLGGDNNVASMLSKIVYAALAWPEFYMRLVSNPSDIPKFIKEIIRLMPLGKPGTFPRELMKPLEVSFTTLPVGSIIYPNINAANRDSKYFTDPEKINMDRVGEPSHLQYGYGLHKCMGMALAQLEINTIIRELVVTFPTLKLKENPENIPWVEGMGLRRPVRLKITL